MNFSRLQTFARNGLNVAKDLALSAASAWLINHYQLHRFGKMTSLRIDSSSQEIHVSLDLHGEDKPIDLTLSYRLFEEHGESMIEVMHAEASRPWITALLNEIVPANRKRQPIPAFLKTALTQVVK